MKNIYLILLINIFLFPFYLVGMEKKPVVISQQKMREKSFKIQSTIERHKYMVVGLGILGTASQLSFLLPWIMGKYVPESEKQVPVMNQNAPTTTWTQAMLGLPGSVWSGVKNTFFTTQGWKNIAYLSFNVGYQLGAMHIMGKIAETIQHPDTLRWYLYAKIPYESAFEMMKEIVKKLENPTISQEQKRYNTVFLRLAIDRLTHYVEDIGAYMMYKSRQLIEKEIIKFTINDLIDAHTTWVERMTEQLNVSNINYSLLNNLIQSYEQELSSRCKNFSIIEGESEEQKRSMIELLQE